MNKSLLIPSLVGLILILSLISCDKTDNSPQETALISNNVSALVADDDIIWIGTDSGLFRFENTIFTNYSSADGLVNDTIMALAIDNNGILWIGTIRGISRFDGENFTNYSVSDGLVSNEIFSLTIDLQNNIWIGTRNNSISKFDGSVFTNYIVNADFANGVGHIHTLCCDSDGNIWIGSCSTGLSKLSGTNWTHFINRIKYFAISVYCTSDGTTWGGFPGGPYRFKNNIWTEFTSVDAGIWAITEDLNGNVWFGTYAGILYFHDNTWTKFSNIEGLADEMVFAIACDSKGNIWLGGHGLAKISDY